MRLSPSLLLTLGLAACDSCDGSDDTNDTTAPPPVECGPEDTPEAAIPTDEMWTFEGDYWTMREYLGALSAAPGAEADAEALLADLDAALPGEDDTDWTVGIGLSTVADLEAADWAPLLVYEDAEGTTWGAASVCLANEDGVECKALASYDGETVTAGSYSGICATLATAHSLALKLGLVSGAEAVNGCTWKKAFLDKIKTAQGHTGTGTPKDKVGAGYAAYGATCGSYVTMDADVDDWCEQLRAESDDEGKDCHLRVAGTNNAGKPWGHQMQVRSVSGSGGTCDIGVVDTSIQSANGSGADVPVAAGTQDWRVYHNGTNAIGGVNSGTNPASKRMFNSLNVNKVEFICCK